MPTLPMQVIVNGEPLPSVNQVEVWPRLVSPWDAYARYVWRVELTFADAPNGQPPPRRYWAEEARIDEAARTLQITGAIEEPPPVVYITPG